MPYTPHTAADIAAMLARIGVADVDDLFRSIPAEVRLRRPLDLPPGQSEEEVRRRLKGLAARNRSQEDLVSFLGGGVYDAVIPAAIAALAGRSEFLTAYTPYQAEVSQGTLQVIYEWQTFVTRLTGLAVANASMYDGATALAEAIRMGAAARKRPRVVLPAALNPRYRRVVATTLAGEGIAIVDAPAAPDGTTDPAALRAAAAGAGAVVVQNPNYLGLIEPVDALAEAARSAGAALVACVNPVSLSLLKAPGEYGADVAVGEAQPLGMPCSFGGPLLGFLACRDELKRLLPGRVVGRTADGEGRPGYVLTLQTREQHIRREKATSNICSNEALCALSALVYMCLLGKGGLQQVARVCAEKAAYTRKRLSQIPGVNIKYPAPTFNEFAVELPRDAGTVIGDLIEKGFAAGFPLGRYYEGMERSMLVAVTEKRTKEEIGRLAEALEEVLS